MIIETLRKSLIYIYLTLFIILPTSAISDTTNYKFYVSYEFNKNVTSFNENGASGEAKIKLKEGATSWAEPIVGIEISKETHRIKQLSFELFGDARYRRFGYRSNGINYVNGSTNINFMDTTNISISSSEASVGGALKYNFSERLKATASVAWIAQSQIVNTKFGSWNLQDELLQTAIIGRIGLEYIFGQSKSPNQLPFSIYCGASNQASLIDGHCTIGFIIIR